MCVEGIKRRVGSLGGVIWCIIMITRGDVQRVIDAFILEETLYWWLHATNGINAWEPKGPRVIIDVTLDRGNNDPTT